jgi:hypothetical protein
VITVKLNSLSIKVMVKLQVIKEMEGIYLFVALYAVDFVTKTSRERRK